MSEIILTIDGIDPILLYGEKNSRLNLVKKAFPELTITSRGNNLKIVGEKKQTQKAKGTFEKMVRLIKEKHELTNHTLEDILNGENPFDTKISNGDLSSIIVTGRNGKPVVMLTLRLKPF